MPSSALCSHSHKLTLGLLVLPLLSSPNELTRHSFSLQSAHNLPAPCSASRTSPSPPSWESCLVFFKQPTPKSSSLCFSTRKMLSSPTSAQRSVERREVQRHSFSLTGNRPLVTFPKHSIARYSISLLARTVEL